VQPILARVSKRKTPITEEAQPKPTTELRRESRLFRIAKALASGATVTDIADAEGIGRTLASREANSPECRQLIAEFVGDEWQEMRAVFYRSMRAIEQGRQPLADVTATIARERAISRSFGGRTVFDDPLDSARGKRRDARRSPARGQLELFPKP